MSTHTAPEIHVAHRVATMVDRATPGPLGSMIGLPRIVADGKIWDVVTYRFDPTKGYAFCLTGAGHRDNPWTEWAHSTDLVQVVA